MEETFSAMTTEFNVFMERLFHGVVEDPVFEGIVREFFKFDHTLASIYNGVDRFMMGVDGICAGLVGLSEALVVGLTKKTDDFIAADCCKFREATMAITRADAPHSAVAKLCRDLDFNVRHPLKQHLANNRNLKIQLENRKRRLLELQTAKKLHSQLLAAHNNKKRGVSVGGATSSSSASGTGEGREKSEAKDDSHKKGEEKGREAEMSEAASKQKSAAADRRLQQAEQQLEAARKAFTEIDRQVFEWLHILQEYKGDIFDSVMQTMKYLQYEFFAASAHAINHVLPARMEFRPMIEMTPNQLEPQVELELSEQTGAEGDATQKILEKWEKDGAFTETADTSVAVDPLSLSALLAQGFEEGPARKALRLHHNDTQAALDWLLNGMMEQKKDVPPPDAVRMPQTLKRVQRMKELKKKREQREKRERKRQEKAARQEAMRAAKEATERKASLASRRRASHRKTTGGDDEEKADSSSSDDAASYSSDNSSSGSESSADSSDSDSSSGSGTDESESAEGGGDHASLLDFDDVAAPPASTAVAPERDLEKKPDMDDLLGLSGFDLAPPPGAITSMATCMGGADNPAPLDLSAPFSIPTLPGQISDFDPSQSTQAKATVPNYPSLPQVAPHQQLQPTHDPYSAFANMAPQSCQVGMQNFYPSRMPGGSMPVYPVNGQVVQQFPIASGTAGMMSQQQFYAMQPPSGQFSHGLPSSSLQQSHDRFSQQQQQPQQGPPSNSFEKSVPPHQQQAQVGKASNPTTAFDDLM